MLPPATHETDNPLFSHHATGGAESRGSGVQQKLGFSRLSVETLPFKAVWNNVSLLVLWVIFNAIVEK